MLKSSIVLICWVIFSLLLLPAIPRHSKPPILWGLFFAVIFLPMGSLLASRYSKRYILPVVYGLIMGALFGKTILVDSIEMIVATLGTCLLCVFAWFVGQKKYWQ